MSLTITLPDNTTKEFDSYITGHDLAKSIGKKLGKDAICIEIDGVLSDLNKIIDKDSKCKIFTVNDQTSLEVLRHSSAHILAQAVLNLYPDTQYGVGPSIEDGFYYDFLFDQNITEDDLIAIEEEMKKIIEQKQVFIKSIINSKEAKKLFKKQKFKNELIDTADKSEGIDKDVVSIYENNK